MLKKCLVVHSGNRDNYQVAIALAESGNLKALVTDDYLFRCKKPKILLPFIVTSWLAFFLSMLHIVFKDGRINKRKDRILSKKAAKVARQKNIDIVFSYSYYSEILFQEFHQSKILFQLHPHPESVRKILSYEIDNNPISKRSLEQEHELLLSSDDFKILANEARNADIVIAASSFTKHTLLENGITPKRIHIIPYGVDHNIFNKNRIYPKSSRFTILFVGSWNQRKGLSYLVDAIINVQDEIEIELHICGRGITDKSLVGKRSINFVTFHSNVTIDELLLLYRSADLFVFPSLCEGFGHVILEAMASGLPVITTTNTAGIDLIEHGIDGFIVPIRDSESISKHIITLYNDPDLLKKMGSLAFKKAEQFTYERFKQQIIEIINE